MPRSPMDRVLRLVVGPGLVLAFGVLTGSLLGNLVNPKLLSLVAGSTFVLIGVFFIVGGLRGGG